MLLLDAMGWSKRLRVSRTMDAAVAADPAAACVISVLPFATSILHILQLVLHLLLLFHNQFTVLFCVVYRVYSFDLHSWFVFIFIVFTVVLQFVLKVVVHCCLQCLTVCLVVLQFLQLITASLQLLYIFQKVLKRFIISEMFPLYALVLVLIPVWSCCWFRCSYELLRNA